MPDRAPSDTEIEELVQSLGLAVFQAQSLEYTLATLFAASNLANGQGRREGETLRELMDTRYGHTLGRIVIDAARDLQLTDEVAKCLEAALAQRNWLIHHFYREFAPFVFSFDLLRVALTKVREVARLLEGVSALVFEEANQRLQEAGTSSEELRARAERATKQYLREHLDL